MVAAAVAAASLACRPAPGLGTVSLVRGRIVRVVDLGSCRVRVRRAVQPRRGAALVSRDGRIAVDVRASGRGKSAKQTIRVTDRRDGRSRAVFSETQSYRTIGPGESPGPIVLLGLSGDDRWVFFTIDPGGSGSIAADGLTLRVVSTRGGPAHRLAPMLVYGDYLAWCGGRLVFSAGMDRVAADRKWLLAAAPPRWRARPLVRAPARSWGSLACARDGRSVIAQSQPQSEDPGFFSTHWSLWRVALDGSLRRLTAPPRGYADESPRISRDGRTILFVRSHRGVGRLYALRDGRLLGPLLSFGYSIGYYGHQDWWRTARWSLG